MIKISFTAFMRIGVLLAVFALVGCGGSSSTVNPLSPTRVIAFGDSYSSVGVGNLFTVDTGEANTTVASRLASIYGFTLTDVSGTPNTALASSGAFSYAIGDNEAGAFNSAQYTSVATQISSFLAKNAISSTDLIIITAGTQDIFNGANMSTATTTLANSIQSLTNAGAQYVVVMLPVDLARTPWALNNKTALERTALTNLTYDSSGTCNSYSCKLLTTLVTKYPATSSHQPVLVADVMSYFNLITGTVSSKNPTGNSNTFSANFGGANPDTAVCVVATTPNNCTSANTTAANHPIYGLAYTYANSVFADSINLTPFANRLLADYIYNTIFYRAGWR